MGSHVHPWLPDALQNSQGHCQACSLHSCASTTSVWFEVYHKDFVSSAVLVLLVNLVEACPRSRFYGKLELGPGSSMWGMSLICDADQGEERLRFALCVLSLHAHHH